MCACAYLFVCVFWAWPVLSRRPKPQTGVPYRDEGSLLMVQTQLMAPASKGPQSSHPLRANGTSLKVDHAIHQLWWAQGLSNTRTAALQVVVVFCSECPPPPKYPTKSSKPICCRRCDVRPLTLRDVTLNRILALPLLTCNAFATTPKTTSSFCKFRVLQQTL